MFRNQLTGWPKKHKRFIMSKQWRSTQLTDADRRWLAAKNSVVGRSATGQLKSAGLTAVIRWYYSRCARTVSRSADFGTLVLYPILRFLPNRSPPFFPSQPCDRKIRQRLFTERTKGIPPVSLVSLYLYSIRKNQKTKEKLAFFIFNYVICSLFCNLTTKSDIE
jgi:hypothetical protein